MTYYGIDGCKLGWFFVGLDDAGGWESGVLPCIDDIQPRLDAARVVLIDIPIGLPSRDIPDRLCDAAARRMIRPRGSCVFPAPTRAAIQQPTYARASAENQRLIGKKLSRQSWGIAPKIRQVDAFIRKTGLSAKIREMHPEVAFHALNGGESVLTRKKDAAGFRQRSAILARYFPEVEGVVNTAREQFPSRSKLADDDILDALVGAVTARYFPTFSTLPEAPAKDEHGLAMEIVYAEPFAF